MPTAFARRLASIAVDQYDRFRFQDENDPVLSRQIERYWTDLGLTFPGPQVPWSAVFVSWCALRAGAVVAEFPFSAQHSQFVFQFIRNALSGTGVFRALDIGQHAPEVGDIIQNNREGNRFDYAHARTHRNYASHTAIVIETGVDAAGRFAMTIGGNESDSIRRKQVVLTASGKVRQRTSNPYICVIQTLK